MDILRKTIGIDIGTSKAVAYVRGQGVVFREASIVAMDNYSEKILAVGEEAKKMLGRTPGNVECIKPIQEGVIAHFEAAEAILRYVIKKSAGRSLFRPNVILSVPSHITQVQKGALMQACKNAGAHKVFMIEEVLSSAFGIGVDIKDPRGHLIMDIGAGSVSMGIIAGGQVIISAGRPVGGESFNQAIRSYLGKHYGIFIGDETAEKIKVHLATLSKKESPLIMEVAGRSRDNGLPQKVFLNSNEIADAIAPVVEEIFVQLKMLLSRTPPTLSADLFNKGAYLTGSSAQIDGLAAHLSRYLGIPVRVVENPGECTVKGTAKALQWIEDYDAETKKDYAKRKDAIAKKETLRKR